MKKIILSIVLLLFSCATTGKLMRLQLDMTKPQVVKAMGNPSSFRGSLKNRYGQKVEVYEYALYKTDDDAFRGWHTYYWLLFVEGHLVQWGQAGDWEAMADQIYEIRYK